jgi:hypothetical protein
MKIIENFLSDYPTFIIIDETKDKIILKGYLEFFLTHKDIKIYKKILLKIKFYKNYPIFLPKIYDIENILLNNFHKNPDGSLCLGTEIDIRRVLFKNNSLSEWIKKCVEPFIFSSVYFEKYGMLIFGEREHGVIGEINSFKDFFNFLNFNETYLFLKFIFCRKYRRKIFKKKSKIYKLKCPYCNNKFLSCPHLSRLKELNFYFNRNFLGYVKNMINEFESEMKTNVGYKK